MDHAESIKEVFRHVLFRLGAERLLNRVRRLRGREIGHLQPRVIADLFSYIYSNKLWVESEDQTSLSGSGSTASATGDLISQLSDFLKQHQCKRLLDVGCGDFNWMQGVPGDFDYVGIDIVPEVIASNNEKFGNARRKFICANAAESSLNFGADVVICREVLFHLSFATGRRLLRNMQNSGAKYILLTNDSSIWFNSDIKDGDFRRINLRKAPYSLPIPETIMVDDKVSSGRQLAVWLGGAN